MFHSISIIPAQEIASRKELSILGELRIREFRVVKVVGVFSLLLIFVYDFGSWINKNIHEFDDGGLVWIVLFGDDFVGGEDGAHGE